ncbi:hypothetical protein FRC09_012079 [Ceratobasidium sp. 395]|nr:hypothetical protein FRC09_012079 [Ceratobasidium sp. 395]
MTERVQRTYTGLLCICAGKLQKEWARNLPAIEFAVNSARSEATGLSPFYLNYGRTPSLMVNDTNSKFPGVREHVERIKLAIMVAHDALIDARAKMTRAANKHRRPAEIKEGRLVYVSTQNMRLPKGQARKLAPKFVGPYKVARVLTQGASFEIDLPKEMRARGIHPVFHASLLRMHVPSDDRKFPGREYQQIVSLGDTPQEWSVDRILTHKGKGRKAIFQLQWKTGDTTWEPYRVIRHLEALNAYCEAQGVSNIGKLSAGTDEIEGSEPKDYELNLLWLVGESGEGYKADEGENSTHPPPSNPYSHTSFTETLPQPSDMAESEHVHIQSLKLMLESQNRSQSATQDAMIRMAETTGRMMNGRMERGNGKGRGGKRSHRQRKAKAKAAGQKPGARRGQNSSSGGNGGSSGHTHHNTQSHNPHDSTLALSHGDWPTGTFDAANGVSFEQDLLTGTHHTSEHILPIPENLPVPAYTSPANGAHALPTQPTQSEPIAPTQTPQTVPTHTTQVTLPIQDILQGTENSASTEELIDYEDEHMEEH